MLVLNILTKIDHLDQVGDKVKPIKFIYEQVTRCLLLNDNIRLKSRKK